jgi:hypothetical protein
MLMQSIAIMTTVFCCSITSTDKVIEIPLSEVWAHGMPGTRRIAELMSDPRSEDSLMGQIGKEHSFARGKKPAGPALAVEGRGLEALKNAHAVITGRSPRSDSLSKDHEVSIAFFTLTSSRYVHLTKVTRSRQTIQVRFEFIPHETKDLTQHFALIPMGKLPKGKFQVEVIAEPLAQRFIEKRWKEFDDERKARIISSSFEFEVR